jgi:hypothetical protein
MNKQQEVLMEMEMYVITLSEIKKKQRDCEGIRKFIHCYGRMDKSEKASQIILLLTIWSLKLFHHIFS